MPLIRSDPLRDVVEPRDCPNAELAARSIAIGNKDSVAAEPVTVGIFLSFVLAGLLPVISHRLMMDGNQQVAVQIVHARHTVEQTGHSRSARDQSDCFVEPCLVQRLRDHVGELRLNSYSGTPRALSAPGEVAVSANINEHPKCRSRATIAVSRVLRCSVLGAHRLPGRAGKHRASPTVRRRATLLTAMDQNCASRGFATQATLCGNSPLSLYLFPCRRTNKYHSVVCKRTTNRRWLPKTETIWRNNRSTMLRSRKSKLSGHALSSRAPRAIPSCSTNSVRMISSTPTQRPISTTSGAICIRSGPATLRTSRSRTRQTAFLILDSTTLVTGRMTAKVLVAHTIVHVDNGYLAVGCGSMALEALLTGRRRSSTSDRRARVGEAPYARAIGSKAKGPRRGPGSALPVPDAGFQEPRDALRSPHLVSRGRPDPMPILTYSLATHLFESLTIVQWSRARGPS